MLHHFFILIRCQVVVGGLVVWRKRGQGPAGWARVGVPHGSSVGNGMRLLYEPEAEEVMPWNSDAGAACVSRWIAIGRRSEWWELAGPPHPPHIHCARVLFLPSARGWGDWRGGVSVGQERHCWNDGLLLY